MSVAPDPAAARPAPDVGPAFGLIMPPVGADHGLGWADGVQRADKSDGDRVPSPDPARQASEQAPRAAEERCREPRGDDQEHDAER